MLNSFGRINRDDIGLLLCWRMLIVAINQLFDLLMVVEVLEAAAVLYRWQGFLHPHYSWKFSSETLPSDNASSLCLKCFTEMCQVQGTFNKPRAGCL